MGTDQSDSPRKGQDGEGKKSIKQKSSRQRGIQCQLSLKKCSLEAMKLKRKQKASHSSLLFLFPKNQISSNLSNLFASTSNTQLHGAMGLTYLRMA